MTTTPRIRQILATGGISWFLWTGVIAVMVPRLFTDCWLLPAVVIWAALACIVVVPIGLSLGILCARIEVIETQERRVSRWRWIVSGVGVAVASHFGLLGLLGLPMILMRSTRWNASPGGLLLDFVMWIGVVVLILAMGRLTLWVERRQQRRLEPPEFEGTIPMLPSWAFMWLYTGPGLAVFLSAFPGESTLRIVSLVGLYALAQVSIVVASVNGLAHRVETFGVLWSASSVCALAACTAHFSGTAWSDEAWFSWFVCCAMVVAGGVCAAQGRTERLIQAGVQ